MWTGVYPHRHGVTYNVYDLANALRDGSREKRNLFEYLQSAGYATAYYGKWHLGDEDPGVFDVWDGFNSLGSHWIDGKRDGEYKPDVQTTRLIDFLEQRAQSDQPFLAVIGYYPPHTPYTAPKRFYEHYRGRGVPFAGYYAAVSAIDDNVGRVIAAMDELGLREDTLVLFFSDHGDTFRYRHSDWHKFVCHEEAIKVPLIARWSGRIAEGRVIRNMVGLQDLMPTVLECTGIEMPDHLHGASLVPLLEGMPTRWREAYYVENIAPDRSQQRCIRTERWKLILNEWPFSVRGFACPNSLFDLENDPEEELNLYDTSRKDSFDQYRHLPSFTDVIIELVHLLKKYAKEIDDATGCQLAENCLLEMRHRRAKR
jgi:choline-sulfatase